MLLSSSSSRALAHASGSSLIHQTAPLQPHVRGGQRQQQPGGRGRHHHATGVAVRAQQDGEGSSGQQGGGVQLEKELSKSIRQTATTFAPRSSTAKGKNPAVKGSVLYNVFEVQAWLAVVVGGLLSFNAIFPSDEPNVARLMGMWSLWMFTIPSLRAKECTPKEKDALNILFVATPLLNVILPFVWKSFPFIFCADVVTLVGVYYWKGAWQEAYGIPFSSAAGLVAAAPAPPSEEAEQE